MATKRPLSGDFDGAPMDPKRFCAEGPSSLASSLGGTTLPPLPPVTSSPSTVSSLRFSVPASRPLFGVPVQPAANPPITHSIGQGPPPPLNPSVWYMPTLHAGAITMQQESNPLPSPDSAILLSSSSASTRSRQPICSVDTKPTITKGQGSLKNMRAKILKNKKIKITALKQRYENLLREKLFLESGGNLMEFVSWRKKPNVPIKSPLALECHITKSASADDSSVLPSATTVQIPLSTVSPGLHATPPKRTTPISPSRSSISFPSTSPRPATRAHASFSTVYENSHEDIVMRARQEAEVMKSISELRKEGLWTASRLPKVQEPARIKTHWDYLLEEMQWLATDFGNEKRWKMNAARKVCIVCV